MGKNNYKSILSKVLIAAGLILSAKQVNFLSEEQSKAILLGLMQSANIEIEHISRIIGANALLECGQKQELSEFIEKVSERIIMSGNSII